MDREEIIKKVGTIFKERLNIVIEEKNFNEPVLGSEWNMLSSDLVYVFFDLEKAFGIQITEEDIDNECLFTVEAMINMVAEKTMIVWFHKMDWAWLRNNVETSWDLLIIELTFKTAGTVTNSRDFA